MWERTITIGSAGKTFSVTGWKIGWAYGPEHLMHNLHMVHQNCVYTCPTPIQVNYFDLSFCIKYLHFFYNILVLCFLQCSIFSNFYPFKFQSIKFYIISIVVNLFVKNVFGTSNGSCQNLSGKAKEIEPSLENLQFICKYSHNYFSRKIGISGVVIKFVISGYFQANVGYLIDNKKIVCF